MNIEKFDKRWTDLEREVLSSVRRQLKMPCFNIGHVNDDFQKSCDEWFNGHLAASLWYKELVASCPDKAVAFESYLKNVKLTESNIPMPSVLWAYILTALSLPVSYFAISGMAEWAFIGKFIFAIGVAVLVWSICESVRMKKIYNFEENVVSDFQDQLRKHRDELIKILS